MRELTLEWWELAKGRDTLVTSEAVFAELSRAPEPKRLEATVLLRDLPVLSGGLDVDTIVNAYLAHKLMPTDALGDARHLALATFHRCAILATWNCLRFASPFGLCFAQAISLRSVANTSPMRTSWHTSAA